MTYESQTAAPVARKTRTITVPPGTRPSGPPLPLMGVNEALVGSAAGEGPRYETSQSVRPVELPPSPHPSATLAQLTSTSKRRLPPGLVVNVMCGCAEVLVSDANVTR